MGKRVVNLLWSRYRNRNPESCFPFFNHLICANRSLDSQNELPVTCFHVDQVSLYLRVWAINSKLENVLLANFTFTTWVLKPTISVNVLTLGRKNLIGTIATNGLIWSTSEVKQKMKRTFVSRGIGGWAASRTLFSSWCLQWGLLNATRKETTDVLFSRRIMQCRKSLEPRGWPRHDRLIQLCLLRIWRVFVVVIHIIVLAKAWLHRLITLRNLQTGTCLAL